jgi:hypothetical protein
MMMIISPFGHVGCGRSFQEEWDVSTSTMCLFTYLSVIEGEDILAKGRNYADIVYQ